MAHLDLQDDETLVSVVQRYRVYALFTKERIPLWTCLLKWCLRHRQGYPVRFTHSLLAVQDMTQELVMFYEMSFYDGMEVYTQDYETVQYDNQQFQLTISSGTFFGCNIETVYDAVDVTTQVQEDIGYLWYKHYTNKRLTPLTLLTHMFKGCADKVTWTCTGIVQVLLSMPVYTAFINPLTPDELRATLIDNQQ